MLTAREAREQLVEQHSATIDQWVGVIGEEINEAVSRGESQIGFTLFGAATPGYWFILNSIVKVLKEHGYRVNHSAPNLYIRWD